MRAYRALLAHPSVGWLVAGAVASRIAMPVLSLSLLIAARTAYGSYALGGVALAGYSFAFALSVPITGRLIDRLATRPVLLGCVGIHLLAYAVVLLALYQRAPATVLVTCTVLLGASVPPIGPVIRSAWPAVVPAVELRSAYALDAVIYEAALIGGPLLVALLVTFVPAHLLLAVAGLGMAVGVLVVLGTPAIKMQAAATPARPERHLLGPLGYGQVRIVLGVVVFDAFCYGCLIVGITAAATAALAAGVAGVLIGTLSAGAVVSGLLYGSRGWSGSPRIQLAVLYSAGAVLLVGMGAVANLMVLALILVPLGLLGGPRDALAQLLLGKAAAPQHRTEAFGWLSTVVWVGYGLGTSVASQLVGPGNGQTSRTFLAAAAASIAAAAIALWVRDVESGHVTRVAPHPGSATMCKS